MGNKIKTFSQKLLRYLMEFQMDIGKMSLVRKYRNSWRVLVGRLSHDQ